MACFSSSPPRTPNTGPFDKKLKVRLNFENSELRGTHHMNPSSLSERCLGPSSVTLLLPTEMLPFHQQMVGELLEEDGITVLASGLGLVKVLASLLSLHSPADGLLLLLSTSDAQRQAIREEVQDQDPNGHPSLPMDINSQNTSAERIELYNKGGAFSITSRILIVDMLNDRVPLHKVAGIVVNNAHRLTETCAEAFIVRLFRQANRVGFIRAFSDRPQAMSSGFAKTERIMKSLFVRRLYIWPRFHLSVSQVLEESPPEVVDIRMPLTAAMAGIQSAIIEVMDACLKELRKTNKVDIEELTVENGLFKSFDEIVRSQLDPIWHTVGRKTKQLVGDLKTLRKLAEYLLRYDAVTFLKYLDTLRASEGVRSVWIFANPTHKIFELAKRRVYMLVRTDGSRVRQEKGGTQAGRGRGGGRIALKRKTGGGRIASVENDIEIGGKCQKVGDKSHIDAIPSNDRAPGNGASVEGAHVVGEGTDEVKEAVQEVELEAVVEEMPKWRILREVLEEIEEERQKFNATGVTAELSQNAWGEGGGPVLVACKDERMCMQLQDVISHEPREVMREEWKKYLLSKAELHGMRMRNKKKPIAPPKWAGVMIGKGSHGGPQGGENRDNVRSAQSEEQQALMAAAAEVAVVNLEVIALGEDVAVRKGLRSRGRGRGRGRGRTKGTSGRTGKGKEVGCGHEIDLENKTSNEIDSSTEGKSNVTELGPELPDGINLQKETVQINYLDSTTSEKETILEGEKGRKPIPPVHFYALESEQRILEVVRPLFVVVYDPDMCFVRELEVYKAKNQDRPFKVYFLFYEESTEGRKFEASIRRENTSFESLIRQKASMMIPVDQDGRMLHASPPKMSATGVSLNAVTRKAGGRKQVEKQMQVVVDMREFGSSLPSVLHQQGMKIIPVTLEVGDYILSNDICVERKSVADLFSSFASGRLYHQAETMTRHYRLPVLLIEFSQDKSFSFQSASDVGEDIVPANIISKVSLLVLHFPRLRIVWSRSLHATADIFAALKANQDEPDLDRAMRVGVPTEDGLIEGDIRAESFNTTAVELLRRLPGVTDANYRSLMDGCKSIAEIALLSVEELAELMGGRQPARMLRDFFDAKCPTLV